MEGMGKPQECTDFKTQGIKKKKTHWISQHKIISPLTYKNLETSNI